MGWIDRLNVQFCIENIMDISYLDLLSPNVTKHFADFGMKVTGVEKNRRSKGNRDRWSSFHSSRRTPLFRKRDLTFLERLNRVLGRRRSSARGGTLARPPLPRRRRITLVNVDDRYGPSNLASGVSRCWQWRRRRRRRYRTDGSQTTCGRNDRFSNTMHTDRRASKPATQASSRPLYLTGPSTIAHQVL